MVEVRTEFDGPGAAKEEIEDDGCVVDLGVVEVAVFAEAGRKGSGSLMLSWMLMLL